MRDGRKSMDGAAAKRGMGRGTTDGQIDGWMMGWHYYMY